MEKDTNKNSNNKSINGKSEYSTKPSVNNSYSNQTGSNLKSNSSKEEFGGGVTGLENVNSNANNDQKRKKNLTAIIIGSALAFVLTVVLSVTLTLAFFGDTGTGTGNVTMGGPVNVNDTVMDSVNLAGALPGQKINLNAAATVSSTATNTTNAILRAYFTWTVSDGADIASPNIPTDAFDLNATGDAKWVKHGDFYYLTNATDGNMAVIDLTATGNTKTVALVNDYTLSKDLTNAVADKTITITVEFTAVQANLPVGADNALTDTVSTEQARTVFNEISTNDDSTAF